MNENEAFAYMMASEKMSSLIFTMDQTLAFLEDYKIKADDDVRKALNPLLIQMKNWLDK